MRWNPWARVGFAILAPATVGVMLAVGEWASEAGSSPAVAPPAEKAVAPPAARPQASPTPAHVREVQRALSSAGYDPGPIDGIFGPRTKAALRKYIAVPPPKAPSPAHQLITRFSENERRQSP